MVPTFVKNLKFKINVESEQILLLGNTDEAAGKMLQGTLELNLKEATKIKSVTLSFQGKIKVGWSEAYQEKIILNHVWNFVDMTTVLCAGKHTWSFELLLPGNLPQSLESEFGNTDYHLTAILERPSLIQSILVKQQKIRLIRCITPYVFDLVQSLQIRNTWAEKMTYDISVPSKVYAFDDTIPVSINILPIASRLKLESVATFLKEYTTFTANDQTMSENHIVRTVKVNVNKSLVQGWNHLDLNLAVPPGPPYIFANNSDSDMIRIRHRLKFVIYLVNADGHVSELRCALKILIVDSVAMTEEFSTLPAYHELSINSSIPIEDESSDDLWHGLDLLKVPSYQTMSNQVLDCNRLPPAYDALLS